MFAKKGTLAERPIDVFDLSVSVYRDELIFASRGFSGFPHAFQQWVYGIPDFPPRFLPLLPEDKRMFPLVAQAGPVSIVVKTNIIFPPKDEVRKSGMQHRTDPKFQGMGQVSGGPNGVFFQFLPRMISPISPPPIKKSNCGLSVFEIMLYQYCILKSTIPFASLPFLSTNRMHCVSAVFN